MSIDLEKMSREQKIKTLKLLEEYDSRVRYNKISTIFPDEGPLAYYNYPKHMKFFEAGATFNERAMIAANRSGKSVACGYELVCHLTGIYPHWWKGKRFFNPIKAWAASDTNDTTRDIIQDQVLLGNPKDIGSGLIPKHLLVDEEGEFTLTKKVGAGTDFIRDIYVRHVSGGLSVCTLKTYEQGRKKFQGTAVHCVWLDEECPQDIYSECLTRTMTVGGIVMLSFTPLSGLTPLVMSFLPGGMFPKNEEMCGPVDNG